MRRQLDRTVQKFFMHRLTSPCPPKRAYNKPLAKTQAKASNLGIFQTCWSSLPSGCLSLSHRLALSPLEISTSHHGARLSRHHRNCPDHNLHSVRSCWSSPLSPPWLLQELGIYLPYHVFSATHHSMYLPIYCDLESFETGHYSRDYMYKHWNGTTYVGVSGLGKSNVRCSFSCSICSIYCIGGP